MKPLKVGKLKEMLQNVPDDADVVRLADSCGNIYCYIFEEQIAFDSEDFVINLFYKEQ